MMDHQVEKSPLLVALMDRKLTADVVDLDHYRIRGGMAVETDYIIRVEPTGGAQFESFTLSKTYSSFRTLGNQLKKIADNAMASTKNVDEATKKLAQYCETVHHLVETQRLQYLGKVRILYPWTSVGCFFFGTTSGPKGASKSAPNQLHCVFSMPVSLSHMGFR
jgi:hypothetical protein